jgi:Cdc6-like AAA superfamily ATPase
LGMCIAIATLVSLTPPSCCPAATWLETATPSTSGSKVRSACVSLNVCISPYDLVCIVHMGSVCKHFPLSLGVSSESVDYLVFDTLIPKPMLQRYVSLLREHRRVILSGPSGTGKTHLAHRLARHLLLLEDRPLTPHSVVTFNVDHKSSKVRSYAPEAPHRLARRYFV